MNIKEVTKKLTNFLSSNFRVYAGKTDTEEDYYYDLAEYTNYFLSATTSGLAGKQDLLTPGENITIEGNVISSSGGGITTNIKYGRLYNYPAISNADFAPDGYHVPTQTEFETLITELGGTLVAGGAMKKTGLAYWETPNTGATNTSGLNCLGNGVRDETGVFSDLKASSNLHSITESEGDNYSFVLAYDTDAIDAAYESKIRGKAVRLIKDDSTNPGSFTDIDGNVYRTVKIGNQVWLADAWACTKLNDGTPIAEITDATEWAADTTGAYCNYNNDVTNVFKEPAFEEWLSKTPPAYPIHTPTTQPVINAGVMALDCNNSEQCMFEGRTSTGTLIITDDFEITLSNITGTKLISLLLTLTGTNEITFPSSVMCSNPSSNGAWDTNTLTLVSGTAVIVEFQLIWYETSSKWLLKVSDEAV